MGFRRTLPGYISGMDDDNESASILDRLRGTGVGVEDPNIVGDVGPTAIPPGSDGEGDGLLADPPDASELAGAGGEPVDSIEPPDLLAEDPAP